MKLKSLIVLSLMFVFSSVSFAVTNYDIYGFLSETFSGGRYGGAHSNDSVNFFAWGSLNPGTETITYEKDSNIWEGREYTKCQPSTSSYGGAGVTFVNSSDTETQQDMSAFYNGQLKFCVKINESAAAEFPVGIKLAGSNIVFKLSSSTVFPNFNSSKINQWQEVSLKLNSATDSRITEENMKRTSFLFLISYDNNEVSTSSVLNIDNIRWEKSGVGSGMSLSMFKVEDDTEIPGGNSFSFDVNIDEGIHWKVANEYIKINFNYSEYNPCYIKIYTDNTSEKANPKYTGTETNPAGLINVDDTKVKLDMCWRVSGSIIDKNNLKIYQYYKDGKPYLSDKENEGNCYLWMQDLAKHEPDFDNKYSYVWNNGSEISYRGAQFGEYTFEAPAFPLYLYLGANFLNTVTDENYSTNTLTVELLYE